MIADRNFFEFILFNEEAVYLLKISVMNLKCSSCSLITYYDGQEDALLNMGTYLIGYDVLRSYMHSFLRGK